ncbi:DUF1499 domain-containing protein [Variovorax sp. PCZ-1]|uniref:DUF1499 domain-containing protein n=1 Tax=Variovorax sp. PCZ-1 TaxID=2835533 RepID=UPI001BCCF96F|nr:DUF1499 domain-containing protein [Variovorax sp. PCZ-1]MBS7807032.1 DUF1499 domain-containing protein [Variovorax sp. PCZ-1]
MRYLILFLLAVAIVALALLVAGQLGLLRGKAPQDLGLKEGKLKRPSRTQNSVTSQADLWPDHPQKAYCNIAPFKASGDGSAEMAKIVQALKDMPRTVIVKQEAGYIYAQSTTALLKYTDDLEFALDAGKGIIDVRSASRLGQKDFGVNRARIEAIRKAIGQ